MGNCVRIYTVVYREMYNPKKKQSARVDRIAVRIDVRNVLRHHGMEWEKMKDDSWNDRGRKIWRFFLKRFCIQFVQKKKKKQGILRTKSRFVSVVGIVVVHSSRFNTFKQSCMYIPRYVKFIYGLGSRYPIIHRRLHESTETSGGNVITRVDQTTRSVVGI